MDRILKILFVEDVRSDAELIWHELYKNKIAFEKLLINNRPEYLYGLKSFIPDVIISDYSLHQFDGMAALMLRNELAPFTPFILVTGSINEGVAVDCMKAGADDYILKDKLFRLGPAVIRSINKLKLHREKITNETALKESEEKYRHIFENVQDVYYETEIDGKILDVSPSIKILSYELYNREDLIGKSMFDFYDDPGDRQALLSALKVHGHVIDYEVKLLNRDGSLIWCSISAKLIPDLQGIPKKIIGSMRNITSRKRDEELLKESYFFSDSLVKTIPFGMHIVDETGTFLYISDNFKRLVGHESIGKKCWNLYREDKKQCSDCPLIKGIDIGVTEIFESSGLLGDRIFEISYTGMLFKGKKAMLEIFIDITDRKENERELIKAKGKAEESDRLKTAFLHNISHEIRTPMNAIVGFSALLGEPHNDKESSDMYVETIMRSSNHLLAIINDIIDISNLEANTILITKKGVLLNGILRTLYKQYIPRTKEKQIQLYSEAGLPDEESIIMTDNPKLIQVISNLLNNAFKFTHQGIIKFGYSVKGRFLEFYVSDTGIGIPVVHQEKIFDRFFQIENPVSKLYEGTGLGLAIGKGYVDLMGGEFRVVSSPGEGSIFYFTIPFEKPHGTDIPVQVTSKEDGFIFKEKRRILVAEDIESNFKLVSYFLSGTNAELVRAVDGREAVDKCRSDKTISLVLMDIKMPVMDGYTAVKLIREFNPEIPIIAQTAYADDKSTAIKYGFNGYISKPFDKKSLLKVLSEYL